MTVQELIEELRRFRPNDLVKLRTIIEGNGEITGYDDEVASVDGGLYCLLHGVTDL